VQDPAGCCQALTDGRRKYIWYPHGGVEQLFDLETDPLEERNLAAEPAGQEDLERWRGRLVEVLAARGEERFTDGRRLLPAEGQVLTDQQLRARNNFGWRDT